MRIREQPKLEELAGEGAEQGELQTLVAGESATGELGCAAGEGDWVDGREGQGTCCGVLVVVQKPPR